MSDPHPQAAPDLQAVSQAAGAEPRPADLPAPGVRQAPGRLRRLAAGAFYVPAGFALLLRRPRLWPLALLPVGLAGAGLLGGLVCGLFAIRRVEMLFARAIASLPDLAGLFFSLALWLATLAAGLLLGFAVALVLAAPVMERLSQRVELLVSGSLPQDSRGWRWETWQAVRSALFFLAVTPLVFLLGLVPLAGPVLAALWGAYALAHQLSDAPLTRRGLDFAARRAWHAALRFETMGFGLAALVVLLVPLANLLLAPALVAGATLLVAELHSPPAA